MRSVFAAAAAVCLLCGCGGQGHARPSGAAGRAVFDRACARCHTLAGHDTHASGGDLAIAVRSTADLASFARVMPVHLTAAQVSAVAAYVHAAAVQAR